MIFSRVQTRKELSLDDLGGSDLLYLEPNVY